MPGELPPPHRKGPIVARKRPTASEEQDVLATRRRTAGKVLTRAEVRALSRSAPLTKDEFKAHGRLAEQHIEPLRTVLDVRPADPPGR
ncbi:MAG: hypothetical protein QOE31_3587 [Solirubrobacteraceae bacterium]|jgi:hypothetical protein|nr:hypothetical protein [Solirubrobacteraceae bacterium]